MTVYSNTFLRRYQMRCFTLIMCCLLALASLAAAQQSAQTPTSGAESKMTNDEVVKLIAAGLSEQVVITAVRQAENMKGTDAVQAHKPPSGLAR